MCANRFGDMGALPHAGALASAHSSLFVPAPSTDKEAPVALVESASLARRVESARRLMHRCTCAHFVLPYIGDCFPKEMLKKK